MEQEQDTGKTSFHLTHALLIAAATLSHYRRQVSKVVVDDKLIPRIERTESGRLEKIEKFSHYVGISGIKWFQPPPDRSCGDRTTILPIKFSANHH
ncbi:hypothetical protein L195_g041155 [Trifolium pratense]|uniref:Uncharacterized protein n=1 Tax=Trifolium pratense TaxID=57577 RepID=A0A2K3M2T3_TRIPR|nr:hypothetical protein L195_g041155 [Trifolium pratense]